MDGFGLDGEEYIAAVRAGALDPFGHTAEELQEQLHEFDAEWGARIMAMTPEQVEAGAQPLPRVQQSQPAERLLLDEQFVGRLRAMEAQAGRVEGARRLLLAEHMQRAIDTVGDSGTNVQELASMAAVEIGLTTGGMVARMTESWTIVQELPAAHEAAAEGRITTTHLRIIEQQTRPLRCDSEVDAGERARVVEALVEIAERYSTSQLRSKAKKIVNDVLTEPLQIRHDTARQRRNVELFDTGDGMGDLVVHGPILELTAVQDRITQAARKKPKDDPRTFDQFRTDALLELLLAGIVPEDLHGTSAIRAHVSILIPATELLHDEVEQDPALRALTFPAALDGRVLVDRATARRHASDTATWERLFTDPVTGVAVTVDSRRPTAAQRRWLQARDGRCLGPGCDRPVLRADVDHTKDYAGGGTTSLDNLGHLCGSDHHGIKHGSRWKVEQLRGGTLRWTSPIGQVIENAPEPVGPVFTDMPRTPARPPKLTRAQRRARQRDVADRSESDARREREGSKPAIPLPASQRWGGPTTATDAPF